MVSSPNIEAPAAILPPGQHACMCCSLRRFAALLPNELSFTRILSLEVLARNLATDQTRQPKHSFVRSKVRVGRPHRTRGVVVFLNLPFSMGCHHSQIPPTIDEVMRGRSIGDEKSN